MTLKLGILVVVGIVAIGSLSSFADTADFPSSANKKEEPQDKSDSSDESSDDSKEKRSQENIMFGNQQKHVGSELADEIMGMSDNPDSSVQSDSTDDAEHGNDTKIKSGLEDTKLKDVLKDDTKGNDKRNLPMDSNADGNLEMGPAGASQWYSTAPVSQDALQYLLNTTPLQPIHDVNGLYDQEELYRRKRQLHHSELRKRSLRSPLGQMIQARGRRLPRRSMRFKRQVEVQDILSLLNHADPNTAGKLFDQTAPSSSFSNYRYSEPQTFRHPYDFLRHDKNDEDEETVNGMDDVNNNKDDDALLAFPQTAVPMMGSRYYDPEDLQLPYLGTPENEDDEDAHQKWLEHAVPTPAWSSRRPSIFTVSRRSAPLFYPVDYRFVPGYKKRSSFSGRGHKEEQDTDFGKWGRVVNVPEAYASAEDVARLYDLANLLAENESPEIRTRRSA